MVIYKRYADKIIAMAFLDQEARKNRKISLSELKKIDNASTRALKQIISKIGWPAISKVGKEASQKAWLLLQHTNDIKFAARCLRMMKKNIHDIDKTSIPYLADKVNLTRGKRQYYGTIVSSKIVNNKIVIVTPKLRDKKSVNVRRKRYGLEPLENQIKRNKKVFRKYFLGRK